MSTKIAVASLIALCTGCSEVSQNVTAEKSAFAESAAQVERETTNTDWAVEPVLIEQACYAYSECRTTAHGLGV